MLIKKLIVLGKYIKMFVEIAKQFKQFKYLELTPQNVRD